MNADDIHEQAQQILAAYSPYLIDSRTKLPKLFLQTEEFSQIFSISKSKLEKMRHLSTTDHHIGPPCGRLGPAKNALLLYDVYGGILWVLKHLHREPD